MVTKGVLTFLNSSWCFFIRFVDIIGCSGCFSLCCKKEEQRRAFSWLYSKLYSLLAYSHSSNNIRTNLLTDKLEYSIGEGCNSCEAFRMNASQLRSHITSSIPAFYLTYNFDSTNFLFKASNITLSRFIVSQTNYAPHWTSTISSLNYFSLDHFSLSHFSPLLLPPQPLLPSTTTISTNERLAALEVLVQRANEKMEELQHTN
jgi:hypothetical protein